MGAGGAPAAQEDDEIPHDGEVDGDDDQSRQGHVSRKLAELERDERARDDDGEVFGPALSKQQPDAFRQQQGGIAERAEADGFQLAVINREEPRQHTIGIAIVRVYVDVLEPPGDHVGHILVQHVQGSDTDRQQQEALGQLEAADDPEGPRARTHEGPWVLPWVESSRGSPSAWHALPRISRISREKWTGPGTPGRRPDDDILTRPCAASSATLVTTSPRSWWWTVSSAWNTGAMTPQVSPCLSTAVSSSSAGSARSSIWSAKCSGSPCKRTSASGIRAGPPMARRRRPIPTRIRTRRDTSPSCTTASSRTISSCATSSRRRAITSPRPPIPRSCPIWLPRAWPGDSSSWRPSGRRSGVSRAAMPSVSSRPSIRT